MPLKKTSKKIVAAPAPKKRITWTIQPSDDVLRLVEKVLGKNPERGALTQLINTAVRAKGHAAYLAVLDEEISKLEAQRKALSNKAGRSEK
ncbi:MAG: hypothetical protein WCH99_12415 [Verrucomicrobiota bacterium]